MDACRYLRVGMESSIKSRDSPVPGQNSRSLRVMTESKKMKITPFFLTLPILLFSPFLIGLVQATSHHAPSFKSATRLLSNYANANSGTPFKKSYEYETRYFTQVLDHFSFSNLPSFQQRYLVRTVDWLGADRMAPIFFYCGNEGDIEWFAENTGLVWEIAPRFGAMVVFAEHRYYGKSMPYGSKDKAYENADSLSLLTAEQALADFATLLTDLKRNLSAENCPVVLFGGSYGGMLAAWMRLKYPHIAIAALASSAPILQFENIVPYETFYDIVSSDFRRESPGCFQAVKESWDALETQGQNNEGLVNLSKKFHLCQNLNSTQELSDWLSSAYSYLAMVDYPYPSSFMMPLPAYPIKEVCSKIDSYPDGTDVLDRIFVGVSVYYNYTGNVDCFDLKDDPHGLSGWDWQACTEMVMPMSSSKDNSMFPTLDFDYQSFEEGCIKRFGVRPRPRWITTEFGGHDGRMIMINTHTTNPQAAGLGAPAVAVMPVIMNRVKYMKDFNTALKTFGSNMIFSNGLLDPWSGGGVLQNVSESIVALVTKEGAHHIDLRAATNEDPDWLVEQRNSEIDLIKSWLHNYYLEKNSAIFDI